MLTTFDKTKWEEEPILDRQRTSLTARSDATEFRRLYPFKLRILKTCKAYNLQIGDIIPYARCRMTPQFFPFDAVRINLDPLINHIQHMYFNSDEAELMES